MGSGYDGSVAYDTGRSAEAQQDFRGLANQLNTLIQQRRTAVNNTMTNFEATGVANQYKDLETQWERAADRTQAFIRALQKTLRDNDETAVGANKKASKIVDG
jgi:hypothetical protein